MASLNWRRWVTSARTLASRTPILAETFRKKEQTGLFKNKKMLNPNIGKRATFSKGKKNKQVF